MKWSFFTCVATGSKTVPFLVLLILFCVVYWPVLLNNWLVTLSNPPWFLSTIWVFCLSAYIHILLCFFPFHHFSLSLPFLQVFYPLILIILLTVLFTILFLSLLRLTSLLHILLCLHRLWLLKYQPSLLTFQTYLLV